MSCFWIICFHIFAILFHLCASLIRIRTRFPTWMPVRSFFFCFLLSFFDVLNELHDALRCRSETMEAVGRGKKPLWTCHGRQKTFRSNIPWGVRQKRRRATGYQGRPAAKVDQRANQEEVLCSKSERLERRQSWPRPNECVSLDQKTLDYLGHGRSVAARSVGSPSSCRHHHYRVRLHGPPDISDQTAAYANHRPSLPNGHRGHVGCRGGVLQIVDHRDEAPEALDGTKDEGSTPRSGNGYAQKTADFFLAGARRSQNQTPIAAQTTPAERPRHQVEMSDFNFQNTIRILKSIDKFPTLA